MIATAVAFYDVITFVHVSAVVVGFGPTYAYAVFAAVASRDSLRGSLAVARGIVAWNRVALNIAMVLILVTGLYLAGERWDFSEFFISWGLVAILLLFGLAHGYFGPRERQMVEILEEEVAAGRGESTDAPDRFSAIETQVDRMGGIAGLVVLLTIYVMTAKPFL